MHQAQSCEQRKAWILWLYPDGVRRWKGPLDWENHLHSWRGQDELLPHPAESVFAQGRPDATRHRVSAEQTRKIRLANHWEPLLRYQTRRNQAVYTLQAVWLEFLLHSALRWNQSTHTDRGRKAVFLIPSHQKRKRLEPRLALCGQERPIPNNNREHGWQVGWLLLELSVRFVAR